MLCNSWLLLEQNNPHPHVVLRVIRRKKFKKQQRRRKRNGTGDKVARPENKCYTPITKSIVLLAQFTEISSHCSVSLKTKKEEKNPKTAKKEKKTSDGGWVNAWQHALQKVIHLKRTLMSRNARRYKFYVLKACSCAEDNRNKCPCSKSVLVVGKIARKFRSLRSGPSSNRAFLAKTPRRQNRKWHKNTRKRRRNKNPLISIWHKSIAHWHNC